MYQFQTLSQLVDLREKLPKNSDYQKKTTPLEDCTRAWHHSLTLKDLKGSTAEGFANYHVNNLGWPEIAYPFVIEPQNIIDTPKGPRARIVYATDVDKKTYNVGNSNNYAIGICVAGDYRYEELDEPTLASIAELHDALEADNIGNSDLSHHEFPGYSWKKCCVFDYNKAITFLPYSPPQEELPDFHVIQEGDTLWGIAKNDDRFSVDDLIKWNDIQDPQALKIGQRLYLKPVLWIGVVKIKALNVRKGPGINFPIVSVIAEGTEVKVFKVEDNEWLYIGNGQYVSNVDGKYVANKLTQYAGRRVEAIVSKVNFYDTPRWDNPTGYFVKGQGWTIVEEIDTEGSPQYKVKNSKGDIFYITARKDLVKII